MTTEAWNPLFNQQIPLQISLREVPDGLNLTDLNPHTPIGTPRTLRLEMDVVGDNTAMRVDSGLLPTTYDYYGALADVTDNFGPVPAAQILGPVSNTMDFTYTYNEAK